MPWAPEESVLLCTNRQVGTSSDLCLNPLMKSMTFQHCPSQLTRLQSRAVGGWLCLFYFLKADSLEFSVLLQVLHWESWAANRQTLSAE